MKSSKTLTEVVLAIVCNANTICCPHCNSLLVDQTKDCFKRLASGGGKRICLCRNCLQKVMLIRKTVQKKDKYFYSPMLDTIFIPIIVKKH